MPKTTTERLAATPNSVTTRLICLIAGVCWLWLGSGLGSGLALAAEEVREYSQAELALSNSPTPPRSATWEAVTLPDYWGKAPQRYASSDNGWYRLTIDLPRPPETLWGIYLRRFNMNAAVYLNGQFLGDGGSFDPPIARSWNHPLYVTVPPALWHKGENTIQIRIKSFASYGYLAPIFLGPAQILGPAYERQTLLQIEISKALFPVMVAIGLFIFGLWLRRREDVQYLWFSASVLTWSLFSLNMFIKDQPFSNKTWEWIAHTSVDWWVIFFAIFTYRFINQPHRYLERGFMLFGLTASLVYAVIDLDSLSLATRWFHGGSILIGFILLGGLIRAAWQKRNRLYANLAIGLGLLLLLGINDWLFQFKVTSATGAIGLHLHHYFSPFIFLFMAWHLTGRFVTALKEAETLNHELEARVMQAQSKIEQHYQTIQEMENQKAVLQEQERLSREIHDGISGNVSNAIMLTELLRREAPEAAKKRLQQLRSLLDDGLGEMRNLILTMEEDLSTLSELVSHVNDKYEQVLGSLDINYQATISLAPDSRKLTPKESLNLLRILQEALNNIIQHSRAGQVFLEIKEEAQQTLFRIRDDGQGFDLSQHNHGHYGLGNMHKRGSEINAQVEISSSPENGTVVQLRLPLS